MKLKNFIPVIILTGCSSVNPDQNNMTQKDIEGYAIASCFTYQESPYLKDQGDAWASVIVQRMKGSIDILPKIADIIKDEINKGEMFVVRSENLNAQDKTLPVLYCYEIIHKQHIQSAFKILQAK